MPTHRILIHLAARERQPIDPAEIHYLEAEGETTTIRLRASELLVDTRPLGKLEPLLEPHGLLRIPWAEIHRSELMDCWLALQSGRAPSKIEPLR